MARRLTIVSNGHGEDVIGASLAGALRDLDPHLDLRAFPLVDDGAAYRRAGIERLGSCRVLPSGGATVHSLPNLLADLRGGLVGVVASQLAGLARLRSDALLVVGDIYAQALAALVRAEFRAVLQPLVSVRHAQGGGIRRVNRYFMEGIRGPERALMRRFAHVVYARDEATAAWLRDHGVTQARALGNPVVDAAAGLPLTGLPGGPVVALLPGSRGYRSSALSVMADALALLPGVVGLVAWSGGPLPSLRGWVHDAGGPEVAGLAAALRHGSSRLWVLEGRFGDVLASADAALGTAGTANEQAAAAGLPLVTFALPPAYTAAFLANQRRLLGDAVTVSEARSEVLASRLSTLLADGPLRARAAQAGPEAMGPPGGTSAIARDLLQRWGDAGPAPGRGLRRR